MRVRLGGALALDITLPQATVAEAITVSAEAPVVSVVSNSVSSNFDTEFLDRQPLPRNYYNIIQSAPGVNMDYTSSSGSAMLAYGGYSESAERLHPRRGERGRRGFRPALGPAEHPVDGGDPDRRAGRRRRVRRLHRRDHQRRDQVGRERRSTARPSTTTSPRRGSATTTRRPSSRRRSSPTRRSASAAR